MSKKDFTAANPAMAFISTAGQEEEFNLTQPTPEELAAKAAAQQPLADLQPNAEPKPAAKRRSTAKAKPAPRAKPKPKPTSKTEGAPMKLHPEYIETKSKRVQMLMQPSLHNSIKELAEEQGVSINELMHEILRQHVEQQ